MYIVYILYNIGIYILYSVECTVRPNIECSWHHSRGLDMAWEQTTTRYSYLGRN